MNKKNAVNTKNIYFITWEIKTSMESA